MSHDWELELMTLYKLMALYILFSIPRSPSVRQETTKRVMK